MSVPAGQAAPAPDVIAVTCGVCNTNNGATATFCGSCGARLCFFCWSCGTIAPMGRHFCQTCGTELVPPVKG